MIGRILALFLSVYIPFWIPSGAIVSGGDAASGPVTGAFDGNVATSYASSQTGSGVNGIAWLGVLYPNNELILTGPFRVVLNQCNAAGTITSVKLQVHTGLGWSTGTTKAVANGVTAWTSDEAGNFDGIRLLANANPSGSNRWIVCELGLYMEQPDPAGQVATDTPTATLTPSITPTPSNTPTQTPNFYVVVTSTQGAAMAVQRTATFGEILVFSGLMAVFGILTITFAYNFWTKRGA
jgi:hypothetical protein